MNQASAALERVLEEERRRRRSFLAWAVILFSISYFLINLIPWAAAGFPVVE